MNNKSNEKPHINFNDVGRLGSKKNDIKNFIKHLPLDSEIIIEPFAGSFQVIKKVYGNDKYQKLLRDGRLDLTRQGIYEPTMMTVLKKARCTVERTNFECSLSGE